MTIVIMLITYNDDLIKQLPSRFMFSNFFFLEFVSVKHYHYAIVPMIKINNIK